MEDSDAGCDFFKLGGSMAAVKKRITQLENWKNSVTNKQPDYISPTRSTARVKFGNADAFVGAVKAGDTEEVRRLLEAKAADVNSRNSDNLTALHQTCIEGDLETARVLIEHGADVNAQDIDGWTPLHGAASCGHTQIVRLLLENNAFPAVVSLDGETPSDVVEEDDDIILNMIKEKVEEQDIDVDALKTAEENAMMEDALKIKEDPSLDLVGANGVTPLHVAAAKNYGKVLKVLLSVRSVKSLLDAADKDGWTPLHAAIFWGNMEVAEQLVESGADLLRMTHAGDSIDDLCDPDCLDELENLKKLAAKGNSELLQSLSSHTGEDGRPPSVMMRSFSREVPLMRRRMSREVVMLDMTKEREEREMFSPEGIKEVDLSNGHMTGETNGKIPKISEKNSLQDEENQNPPSFTESSKVPESDGAVLEGGGQVQGAPQQQIQPSPQKRWVAWADDDDDAYGEDETLNETNSDLTNDHGLLATVTANNDFVGEDTSSKNDEAVDSTELELNDLQHVNGVENSLPMVSESGIKELPAITVSENGTKELPAITSEEVDDIISDGAFVREEMVQNGSPQEEQLEESDDEHLTQENGGSLDLEEPRYVVPVQNGVNEHQQTESDTDKEITTEDKDHNSHTGGTENENVIRKDEIEINGKGVAAATEDELTTKDTNEGNIEDREEPVSEEGLAEEESTMDASTFNTEEEFAEKDHNDFTEDELTTKDMDEAKILEESFTKDHEESAVKARDDLTNKDTEEAEIEEEREETAAVVEGSLTEEESTVKDRDDLTNKDVNEDIEEEPSTNKAGQVETASDDGDDLVPEAAKEGFPPNITVEAPQEDLPKGKKELFAESFSHYDEQSSQSQQQQATEITEPLSIDELEPSSKNPADEAAVKSSESLPSSPENKQPKSSSTVSPLTWFFVVAAVVVVVGVFIRQMVVTT